MKIKKGLYFFLLFILSFSARGQNYITAFEYWCDTNYDAHLSFSVLPQQQFTFSTQLTFPGLSKGLHSYNIRFQQSNGFWSQTSSGYFIKTGESGYSDGFISGYRYWVTGIDSVVSVTLPSPTDPLYLFIPIDLSWVHHGNNYLHVQLKDLQNNWSVATLDSFYKSAIPVAAFTSNDTLMCSDDSVHFINNSNDADAFLWHFGDGDSSTAFEPAHYYQQPGVYTVSLTVTDTATGQDTTLTINDYIHVMQGGQASFTFTQNGLNVTFSNTSLNANSNHWDFGDSTSSAISNPVHTYLHDGNYTVVLTITDSCGALTDTQYVSIILNENELISDKSVIISREDNSVKITFNSSFKYCIYSLTSVTGQIMLTRREENIVPGFSDYLSLEGLSAGTYFLNLRDENKSATRLLLKTH